MQNKNNKCYGPELIRPQRLARVINPIIKSRILFTHQSKYNENTKVSSSHNLVVPFVEGNNGGSQIKDTLVDEKSQELHALMLQTFDKLLLQLDELFMNIRTEERNKTLYCLPVMNIYKDICERLRLEVLIAIDKVDLINTKGSKNDKDIDFLERMNNLKSQLSQIRWQYHQAIQEFNVANK